MFSLKTLPQRAESFVMLGQASVTRILQPPTTKYIYTHTHRNTHTHPV